MQTLFRALLWKEWRQLALVRWGGMALGAILPIAFIAGAELGSRGWLPTGLVKAYSARDLMYESLPSVLAIGLWPLIALMSTAQAFTGDRSSGTDSFLLQRPVPRGAAWRARVVASLGTLLAVVFGSGALGAIAAFLSGTPPAVGWSRWLILAGVGLGWALLGWIGGALAGSLVESAMLAVLLGGTIGFGTFVLAACLTVPFEYARFLDVPLGLTLPWLLIPAYLLAAYSAGARGEPNGAARTRRALLILGPSLGIVLVLFAAGAPIALRADAARGQHTIFPNAIGSASLVRRSTFGGGGWIIDARSDRSSTFLPPPVIGVAWSPDGEHVALTTASGWLGYVRQSFRVEIRRRDGNLEKAIALPFPALISGVVWSRDGIAALLSRLPLETSKQEELYALNPASGSWTSTGIRADSGIMRLVGPLDDGRLLLRELEFTRDEQGHVAGVRNFELYEVALIQRHRGEALLRLPDNQVLGDAAISRSGRHAEIGRRGERRRWIVQVPTGAVVDGLSPRDSTCWLRGDRIAWIENKNGRSRLIIASISDGPRAVRAWTSENVGLRASPDGTAVFVSALPTEAKAPGSAPEEDLGPSAPETPVPEGNVPEEIVYTLDGDRFIDIGPPFSDRLNDHKYTVWAGPKTLARIAPGLVAFEDVDAPGKRRFVLGSERDLR